MAEIATIARPYADALFKAAGADAAGVAVWLDELAAVAANDQLRQFADAPKSSSAQVFDVISGVLKNALPAMGQNFLRTVIDNGRIADRRRARGGGRRGARHLDQSPPGTNESGPDGLIARQSIAVRPHPI